MKIIERRLSVLIVQLAHNFHCPIRYARMVFVDICEAPEPRFSFRPSIPIEHCARLLLESSFALVKRTNHTTGNQTMHVGWPMIESGYKTSWAATNNCVDQRTRITSQHK